MQYRGLTTAVFSARSEPHGSRRDNRSSSLMVLPRHETDRSGKTLLRNSVFGNKMADCHVHVPYVTRDSG